MVFRHKLWQSLRNMNRTFRKLKTYQLLGFITLFFAPQWVYADYYLHYWENQQEPRHSLRIIPEVRSYFTSSNFDSTSQATEVSGLSTLSRVHFETTIRYGLNPQWSLFGRLGLGLVGIQSTTANPTTGSTTESTFGLTDQTIGVNFKVWEGETGIRFSLQAQADLPAYDNGSSSTSGSPFMGDGSLDLTGGAFLSIPLKKNEASEFLIDAGAGFTFRSAGFSSHIPYSAKIAYRPFVQGWLFDLGVFGHFSLSTDGSTGVGGSSVGSGGSFTVNAINPSLLTTKGQVGYRFKNSFAIHAGAGTALFGTNAPKGTFFNAGVEFRLGAKNDYERPGEKTPLDHESSNRGFVKYVPEGNVTRVNDRLNLIKINRGSDHGVTVGTVYDVFSVYSDGRIKAPVARAKVTSTRPEEAALKIIEYFKEVWIEEGFIVKKPLE